MYFWLCLAGTGKSTLVKFIIKELGISEKKVVYCAYTGKACTVLQQKGNKNVSTLHKLLYTFIPTANGKYIVKKKSSIEYDIVIVDECSMVNKDMLDILLSHKNIYIIFLGDPFQIPPVKEEDNGLLNNPHVFLTEIIRQALDNEIIKFSMDIRMGNPLPSSYKGKNVQIYSKSQLPSDLFAGMCGWADQVICATNKSREYINNFCRSLLGHDGEPKVGEKIICLKNNWHCYDNHSDSLVNGTIGTIQKIEHKNHLVPRFVNMPDDRMPYYLTTIETEQGHTFNNLEIDSQIFATGKPVLDSRRTYSLLKSSYCKARNICPPEQFTYGYAITCHKSQGSSWPKVLICEEGFPFSDYEHRRWLYTAITRAEDKVVIIVNR